MILADSFIAFCTLILAVLFWFDVAQMWHIYIPVSYTHLDVYKRQLRDSVSTV